MNYTLLEIVQDILSSMDSDEVNTITDSVEAGQVVTIVKTVYDNLVSRLENPVQKTLFNLTASTDGTKPTLMTCPTGISIIDWVKYNCADDDDTDPVWRTMTFYNLEDFIMTMHQLNPTDDDVGSYTHSVGASTLTFNYRSDRGPMCYTSFDDGTLIFDSYDSDVDATLQSSKTLAYGEKVTTFTASDNFVPNLRPNQFALLFNEAKALAWAELKQTTHAKAEKMARQNWIHQQKVKRTVPSGQTHSGPNYGRK